MENSFSINPNDQNEANLNKAKVNLLDLQIKEEIYWRQKAAAKHLAEGESILNIFMLESRKEKILTLFIKLSYKIVLGLKINKLFSLQLLIIS